MWHYDEILKSQDIFLDHLTIIIRKGNVADIFNTSCFWVPTMPIESTKN